MFSERDKNAVRAVVSVFETGRAQGDYSAVAVLADGAGISYGAHQGTHRSGTLGKIVRRFYDKLPHTSIAEDLHPYLDELESRTHILDFSHDNHLKGLLREAGQLPQMRAAQNEVFDEGYMVPAIHACEGSGFVLPLTLCAVYDSHIQGGFGKVRDRVPVGLSEKDWTTRYIANRKAWLLASSKQVVRNSVYRPKELDRLREKDNWGLETPFTVRGVMIDDAVVA